MTQQEQLALAITRAFKFDECEGRFCFDMSHSGHFRDLMLACDFKRINLAATVKERPLSVWLMDICMREHICPDPQSILSSVMQNPTFNWNVPSTQSYEAGKTACHFLMQAIVDYNQLAEETLRAVMGLDDLDWNKAITSRWHQGMTPLHLYMQAVLNGSPVALDNLQHLVKNPNTNWDAPLATSQATPLYILTKAAGNGNAAVLSAIQTLAATHRDISWEQKVTATEVASPGHRHMLQSAPRTFTPMQALRVSARRDGFTPIQAAINALADDIPTLSLGESDPHAPPTPSFRSSPVN